MRKSKSSQAGMAMVLVMISIVIILGALGLTTRLMVSARHNTDLVVDMYVVEEACKAGIDIAIERLWHQYIIGGGNTTGNLASYKYFIDQIVPAGGTVGLLETAPHVLCEASGVQIDSVDVRRTDDIDGVLLAIEVEASRQGGAPQQVEQTVRISGEPFAGYEYGVLANNINCILCHAGFYNLQERLNSEENHFHPRPNRYAEYEKNPELYGTFDRIKVASLEALLYRPNQADSVVAGTIYTRGEVYNERWQPMTPNQIMNSDLRSFDFSDEDGKLRANPQGHLIGPQNLKSKGKAKGNQPYPFDSVYTNYPTNPEDMTDGPLPETFPAPFPDHNEDRYVDDNEFEEIAQALTGSLQGGVVHGIQPGEYYRDTQLPDSSNAAATSLAATGRYDGNAIIVGTPDNPIEMNGEIAINGDLVLAGTVKGRGQLFVRGNTYITGDVTYADAPGQFGVAEDGTENALAVVTGGSVLMGDYITIRGKQHRSDTSQYPDWSSGTIRARERHRRNMSPRIQGTQEPLDVGYFDPGVIDPGEIVDTMIDHDGNEVPRQGQQFSFTQSELMLFNNLELQKALDDPNYVPRFYGLRDTQPDNVYLYTDTNRFEHATKYNEHTGGVVLLEEHLIDIGIDPATITDRAAFHYMNPADYWIDYDTLREIWWNDEMARTERHSTWRFDGLLYSNNAIFAITRSHRRKGSFTEGKMEVRGAIICPDLGVLTPGPDRRGEEAFTLLYDDRVQGFWSPADTTRSFFSRLAYRVL